MNVSDIEKSGASIGAEFEAGIMASAGEGLVAKILPLMREVMDGHCDKAVKFMTAFWEQFAKNAPIGHKIKRVTVTRSESMRLAHALVEPGLDLSTGTWNELLKRAPKKVSGKGAGGGRKARPPVGPATPDAPDAPDAPVVVPKVGKGKTPLYTVLQQGAIMLALVHQHKQALPMRVFDAVQALAVILDQHKDDDSIV